MLGPVVVSRQTPDEGLVLRAVGVLLNALDLPLAELAVLRARGIFGSLRVARHKRTEKITIIALIVMARLLSRAFELLTCFRL